MGDVVFGFVRDFGPGEEWVAWRGAGRAAQRRRAGPVDRRAPHARRQARGRRHRVRRPALDPRVGRRARRDRAPHPRARRDRGRRCARWPPARLDGMTTLRGCRSVDAAAGAADRPRGGRPRRVHALPAPLAAPLDLEPHSPVVAARTREGLRELAAVDGPAILDGVIDWSLASQRRPRRGAPAARGRPRAVHVAGGPSRGERAPRLRLHRPGAAGADPARRGRRPRRVGRGEPRLDARRARPRGREARRGRRARSAASSAPPAACCWAPRPAPSPASSPGACSASTSSPCSTRPRPARLLFVAPNLGHAATRARRRPDQLLRWVALHETTHALQFGGVPWLREHIAATRARAARRRVARRRAGCCEIPDVDDLRGLVDTRARGRRRRGRPRARAARACSTACRPSWPCSRATPSTSWTRSARSCSTTSARCAPR